MNNKEQYLLITAEIKRLQTEQRQLTLALFKEVFGFDFKPKMYRVEWKSYIDYTPLIDISIAPVCAEQDSRFPLILMGHFEGRKEPQFIYMPSENYVVSLMVIK
jgi:hypothetical protein